MTKLNKYAFRRGNIEDDPQTYVFVPKNLWYLLLGIIIVASGVHIISRVIEIVNQ